MSYEELQQKLYDIYDVQYTPWWKHPAVVIAGVCVVGLCIGAAVWWYLHRRKQRMQLPWDEARAHLAQLNVEEGDVHTFYTTLTDLLKRYLERRYDQSVREKTDGEVADFIATSLSEDESKAIRELCMRAAYYKFSKANVSYEQMQQDREHVYTFIRQTTPHDTKKV